MASTGKKHRGIRRKASDRRRVLWDRTGQVFEELSKGDTLLDASQIPELLERVLPRNTGRTSDISIASTSSISLDPDAVQLVVDTAHRLQQKEKRGESIPGNKSVGKKAIQRAVIQYGKYIQNADKIDEIFQYYDKEQDGYLSRDELLKMLQEREEKMSRPKKLEVTQEDIDWIIEESDSDNTGMINNVEYLPALAAWEELAQMKLEDDGDGNCIVM
ncbi:expressed unknown protein [Seminavis robusta]|uniref:EF-hand domain-containing protein n=1 Tax=Seminavis robusta TaxID=568900 RepID=A0A9N8EU40_9STRA|nr:expressed unknown protein [Seminavis robusta]|eukprot:Sro1691_g291470.1 n/a (217) ;mRNA; r:21717-22367